MRTFTHRRLILPIVCAAGLSLVAACGSSSSSSHGGSGMPGMTMPSFAATSPSGATAGAGTSTASSMPGMDMGSEPMPTGDGLTAGSQGFTFAPTASTLGSGGFSFRILGADGKPVTAFEPDQTKLMHFYLVRSDLTGFQHVHPTMAADGTWTAPLTAAEPGAYRVFASFITKGADSKPVALVLSSPVTAPGTASSSPLPAPAPSTTVDGYTVTVDASQMMAGMAMPLKVSISKGGTPVTDLQPYLDTYAHLSAFHAGDLAFAHLHPEGAAATGTGGPDLTFQASLPKPGDWRLFVQFQTGGVLHTAAITVHVG
ncbi:MAG: hypothetical protein HOW97_03620 [Catenulispora sp.]|nr:hypothetical protein [Catenulispora sp.]NUR61011.1 hypothetical protein [Catenulispora sp.]